MTSALPSSSPSPDGGPSLSGGVAVPWLALLEPTERGRGLTPASSGAQVTRAVRAVGRDAAQWAVEVGQEVAERVALEIPGHAGDGGFDVLRMGTESTTLQLLIALAGAEIETAVTPESLGGIPDFVRRRVSLDEMLRGIALGHSVIAAAFLAECVRLGDAENRHEQMRTLSQRMFVFFDVFSTQMAAFYREEEARWAQSDAASRLGIVRQVLRGQETPTDAAARRLRYGLGRTHVALIVWSSARTLEADQDALYDVAWELLTRAGCEQKLVLHVGIGVVWAWASPADDPQVFAERLDAASLPAHTHAVFGPPGRGIAGFRASHIDAEAAFALQSPSHSPAAVTAYRDVDLLSLLLADRERAVRFARAELGPLGAPEFDELRRTLAMYLEEGGSPAAAARRLAVSRNTVSYRVRRAEELLGRPLTQRRQHLQAALAILAAALGDH